MGEKGKNIILEMDGILEGRDRWREKIELIKRKGNVKANRGE